MKRVWVAAIAALFFLACGDGGPGITRRQALEPTGLFGEHQLLRIEQSSAAKGSLFGNFFIGTGSISGEASSERVLMFYWQPKPGEILVSQLPYGKFKFVIDDTKDIPTVEFDFREQWLSSDLSWAGDTYGKIHQATNLNVFIKSADLNYAVVKISQATLEREVYLPKL